MQPVKIWPSLLLGVTGALSGMSVQLGWWAAKDWFGPLQSLSALGQLLVAAVATTAALFGLRAALRRVVHRSLVGSRIGSDYRRYDTLTYSVFLLLLVEAAGIQFSIPLLYLVGLAFLGAQCALLALVARRTGTRDSFFLSPAWPSLLFLLSGVAALIYQVVWQRVLFAAYGVNIESVTLIVSVFMLGLGLGSLAGGILSKKFPSNLLALFVICELAIGSFGVASLPLIRWVADATVRGSLLTVALVTYGLLCLPTLFMGATLPILVEYLHRHNNHIGKSVGILYCVNTLGAAIASLVTVDVLFLVLGLQATVLVAAGFNVLVASLVFIYGRGLARRTAGAPTPPAPDHGVDRAPKALSLSYPLTLVLAGTAGYISLSQEIVWVRAISYASGGVPHVFGHVIGFFLLGVAAGALLGKKVCESGATSPLQFIAWAFLTTAVLYDVSILLGSYVVAMHRIVGLLVYYMAVAVVAFTLGGILPALCHFGSRADVPVGISLSHIYMANIIGSTAGPLVTGFVLLNVWTLQQNILYLSVLCLVVGGVVMVLDASERNVRVTAVAAVVIVLAALGWLQQPAYGRLLERLGGQGQKHFRHVVQNRSGIIAVTPDEDGDVIWGGGVYDGRFNLDLVTNSNAVDRAYMVAALHPNPEEMLEIGLSGGSWAWVAASHPAVKRVTVVEINPGYFDVIEKYADYRSILSNPKIEYVIDDGRRWLKRHPATRFDFILMNTTFYWRSNITNLLSREFLEICRSHLKEGGVVYFNTTGLEDSFLTAARVFKHVTIYKSFVAASDRPFAMTAEERRRNLLRFPINGRLVRDSPDDVTRRALEDLAAVELHDDGGNIRGRADLRVITEDNMLPEFKRTNGPYGRWYHGYEPARAWTRFYR